MSSLVLSLLICLGSRAMSRKGECTQLQQHCQEALRQLRGAGGNDTQILTLPRYFSRAAVFPHLFSLGGQGYVGGLK